MEYLKAFTVGGLLCVIGQILIDKTKLTPARILVSYVVAGVLLGGLKSSAAGIGAAVFFGFLASLVFRPKDKS